MQQHNHTDGGNLKKPRRHEKRDLIIELRQHRSFAEISKITGVPVGTVKAICSRSKRFTDNPEHRALFTLPEPIQNDCRAIKAVSLPPQRVVTGDHEVDALLWLRDVINTGHPDHITKALQAAGCIKTPLRELERRYDRFLCAGNQSLFAGLDAWSLADLEKTAKNATVKAANRAKALEVFGNEQDALTPLPAERFCEDVLQGVETDSLGLLVEAAVIERFDACPRYKPHTLADCLHELGFWSELYSMRHALGDGCESDAVSGRQDYVLGLTAKTRPRSQAERLGVLQHLVANGLGDGHRVAAILENLLQ